MRIIIFLTLALSYQALYAQINAGKPDDNTFRVFEGGVAAGVNFSQVDGDNYAGFNKIGLNAGPLVHINFNANWSLSLEIDYSQKGSKTKPDPNNYNTFIMQLHYVEVPALINYNDKNRLIFQAGAAYGRLFYSYAEASGIPFEGTYENDEISYVIGGTFLLGELKHWGVNVRYQGSVTSVGAPMNVNAVGLVNRLITFRGIYYF